MRTATVASGVVTYTYNATGQRIEKETLTDTTLFLYDFDKLLLETNGSGAVVVT